MEEKAQGQIITFYSYKGGTGRSMALVNTACLLAHRAPLNRKVLMIDWDLEAPGLHHFFQHLLQPFTQVEFNPLSDSEIDAAPGLIDLFLELDNLATQVTINPTSEADTSKLLSQINLEPFILKTHVPGLFLLKAGCMDEDYSRKINSFNWFAFYDRVPLLFQFLAERLMAEFDHTLIDSRTGATDTSGICTMLMPEKLVTVFTPNHQSLTGVLKLIQKAANYRKESDDLRPLVIYPLPSRIETSENKLRQKWRFGDASKGMRGYQTDFEFTFKEIYGLPECGLDTYFDDIQIQHFPKYAYGEEIAVLLDDEDDRLSLARSYEYFATQLLSQLPPWEYVSFENAENGKGAETTKDKLNKEKLNNLFIQKREIEVGLEYVESEISRIKYALKSETDPKLTILLHWLSGRKELAEKYGKIVFRGFPNLREEAKEKGDLDDFYFEIECYLELIYFSLEKDDIIFLQEPRIPPTFADPNVYVYASSDVYKEVFRILKENIPRDNAEPYLRSKLETHFDELLERLQAYF